MTQALPDSKNALYLDSSFPYPLAQDTDRTNAKGTKVKDMQSAS